MADRAGAYRRCVRMKAAIDRSYVRSTSAAK
jgi:hypothetical protein